jgi:hypothetical protein
MPSARRSAHIFGACSPNVMWSVVMIANAMPIETIGSQDAVGSAATPTAWRAASSTAETAGSPSAPSIRLASVIPSWQADR